MTTKLARKRWHKKMNSRAAVIAQERCQRCNCETPARAGVIHHTEYPFGCYYFDVEPLLKCGVCQWLCLDCHGFLHGQDKPDGPLAKARENHLALDEAAFAAASRDIYSHTPTL